MLDFAKDLAEQAGQLLKDGLGRARDIRFKGEADLVTEMDLASENLIIHAIQTHFPSHAILAEESGATGHTQNGYRWVIDPLDGTVNYAHGVPLFCVSIGLEKDGVPLLGVIHAPVLQETYWAQRGQGAFLNGTRLQVSGQTRLEHALLVTGFPHELGRSPETLNTFGAFVDASQAVRRLGSSAIDLAWVAAGRFDAFWEPRLMPWDVCAGIVLVEEAGGRVTNFDGSPFATNDKRIIASNGHLHNSLLHVMTQTRRAQS
jgi:myo-inositol-1(or 4)-monophosphatase